MEREAGVETALMDGACAKGRTWRVGRYELEHEPSGRWGVSTGTVGVSHRSLRGAFRFLVRVAWNRQRSTWLNRHILWYIRHRKEL